MRNTPADVPAAARARWLAEVAEMLDQAERLVKQLRVTVEPGVMVAELEMRITAAKGEVELLRTSRHARTEADPRWSNLPPWERTF